MRIWLVGGGTAGHVSPLLSVATELERQLSENSPHIHIISDRSVTARNLLSGVNKYATHRIFSGKLRRYRGRNWWQRIIDVRTWLMNLVDVVLLIVGWLQAVGLLVLHRPDIIFINGGSVGLPVAAAAWLGRRPYVVHESDTVLGLANRVIAPRARDIATAFDINLGPRFTAKTITTGIPLKLEFSHPANPGNLAKLRQELGLEENLSVTLVIGGSLGAQRVNGWVISIGHQLLEHTQVILISGPANYDQTVTLAQQLSPADSQHLRILPFSDKVADLMRLSDVVVTRAGATTLTELAAIGRPGIIIPNDMLSGGHQTSNARWFVEAGLAETLSEQSIADDPSVLARAIISLLDDEPRRRRLAEAVKRAYISDSAFKVAQLILDNQPERGRGQ